MTTRRWAYLRTALVLATATSYTGCGDGGRSSQSSHSMPREPSATEKGGPSPSKILEGIKLHDPPPLAGPGDVGKFVDWAGKSMVNEQEDARDVINQASQNDGVAQALIDEVEATQKTDHGRALLVLAILGEMKNPIGTAFLRDFAVRPLPESGTLVDGEIVEQSAQAILQAKAVDGLAYLRTEAGDEAVLQIIAEHPARIVRAEAINAFLWNHDDSADARQLLIEFVREEEAVLIDRVRRGSGKDAESFNAELSAFLEHHPEAVPPPPEPAPMKPPKEEPQGDLVSAPPGF